MHTAQLVQFRRRRIRSENIGDGTPLLQHVGDGSPLGKMPFQVAVRRHHRGDNPPSGDESRFKSFQVFGLMHERKLHASTRPAV